MNSPRRVLGKTRAAIAVARAALMLPRWRLFSLKSPKKRVYEQAFYRRIARGFVTHVELRGTPSAKPGTLYICNHITWLDIPAIASVILARKLVRGEVVPRGAMVCSELFTLEEFMAEVADLDVSATVVL